MEITQYKVGAVTVIRPAGPLLKPGAEALLNQIRRNVKACMGRVILDLEAVPFVDSAGLECLADAADELGSMGLSLRVCGAPAVVWEALMVTGCDAGLEFHADTNSAARSFL